MMTSFHTLPSLKDILNPSDDNTTSSYKSKASFTPTNLNHVSLPLPRSPLSEGPERRQIQLYHSHSVPDPQSLAAPTTTSSIHHTRNGSPFAESLLQNSALRHPRSSSFASDSGGRHQLSNVSSQQITPETGAPDPSIYAVPEQVFQTENLRSSMQIEPRILETCNFSREDQYWVFPDSSQARKYAPGEYVNPQWGITKAGKPRKRLAQACTTCREKKIKCDPILKSDPGSPKCAQCQKFGRDCRFENGPRNPPHVPAVPSLLPLGASETVSTERTGINDGACTGATWPSEQRSGRSKGKFDTGSSSPNCLEEPTRSTKRPKSEVDSTSDVDFAGKNETCERDASLEAIGVEGKRNTTLWDFEPHEVDPDTRTHYLELYFLHVNCASYCMFPKEPFMEWVKTCVAKSSMERTLIFSLLAMGTIFSTREQHKHDGEQFATIAKYGLDKNLGNFVLPLVQSRLVLGLYFFAVGDAGRAWDLAGAGLRSASALKLNLESGIQDIEHERFDYGLARSGFIECRRRTFWSAYIMDRFNGFCSGHLSVIHNNDCLLRLPVREEIYERQGSAETPFFENDIVNPALARDADRSQLGAMGYHAQISSIWGEVLANIYRSSHRRDFDYPQNYEEFYGQLNCQLDRWMISLPPELTSSRENTDRSIREGYIGTYIGLHTLYHATLMKLNRHCRWKLLSPAAIERNIQKAHYHATEVLHIVQTLSRTDRETRLPDVEFAFSTPFTSYAILTAIDILSAGGHVEDLPKYSQLLDSGLEVVAELASFWSIARRHKTSILRRIKDISDSVQDSTGDKQMFATDSPMDTTFPREEDVIYTAPRARLYRALSIDENLINDKTILWVETSYEGGIAYI